MGSAVRRKFEIPLFLILLGKRLVIEHSFEYNGSMELRVHNSAERTERSPLDEALDTFDAALTDLISRVELGGLDQLEVAEKVAVWQRFERIRNRLPLVDHRLIADAQASASREYCSSTMIQFLVWCRSSPMVRPPPESTPPQHWVPGPRCSVNGWIHNYEAG